MDALDVCVANTVDKGKSGCIEAAEVPVDARIVAGVDADLHVQSCVCKVRDGQGKGETDNGDQNPGRETPIHSETEAVLLTVFSRLLFDGEVESVCNDPGIFFCSIFCFNSTLELHRVEEERNG